MQVLHVYGSYALRSRGGGVERYMHHLAAYAATQGDEVTVSAREGNAGHAESYRVAIGGVRKLLQLIGQAQCVHLHGPRCRYAALAGLLAWSYGVPFVYTVHCFYRGKTKRQQWAKWLWDHTFERFLLKKARATIVLSSYWQKYLLQHRLHARKAVVLPNGIDVHALRTEASASSLLTGHPAILSVSRLDPVKAIEDGIFALSEPGMEHAELHLVGAGPDAARLQEIVVQQQLQARVHFYGFQTDEEVARMARGAHLFLLASAEEGMPTTILEMLARNLPVVASDIPGNRSLTEALEWQSIYPLHDRALLARTALQAMQIPVPAALQQKLEQHFDWPVIARAVRELYRVAV